MIEYPRTSTVLKTFGLIHGSRWMESKHARAGRYIHAGAAHLAAGASLSASWFEEWFSRTSGGDGHDLVVHEECRPKLNGYAKFQRDHRAELIAAEEELTHPIYGYVCHPDQILKLQGGGLSFANTIGPYSARSEPYLVLLELKAGMEQAWHELQIASYFLAVEHHYKHRPKAMALYLKPDDYRLEPLPDPWRNVSKWIALMSAYKVLKEHKSNLLEG